MSLQGKINFYDSYLRNSSNNSSKYSAPNFQSSMDKRVNDIDIFWKSQDFINQKTAEILKEDGNNLVRADKPAEAIKCYKRAVDLKPDYVDVYYNLAKTYKSINDIPNAIESYTKLLELSPHDVESLTNLGECYKDSNDLDNAIKYYKAAIKIDPKFDLAQRSLKETENQKLAKTNPQLAQQQKYQYAVFNLQNAVNLFKKYAPKDLSNDTSDIKYVFSGTESMSGHENIAQYEDDQRRIVVTEKYAWAAPEIIAAYLVHESVHAKDHDPYTSITEEQDAYRESVKFWLAYNNGIKDPEMDYASSLYLISPSSLDDKVAEVYSSRDPSIAKVSPHHGMAVQDGSFSDGVKKVKDFISDLISSNGNNQQTTQVSYDKGLLDKYCR